MTMEELLLWQYRKDLVKYICINNYSIAPLKNSAGTEHERPTIPELQRYYDWMLWKMRQEDKQEKEQKDSIDPDKLQELATMKE